MPTASFYPTANADDAFFIYPMTFDESSEYNAIGNDSENVGDNCSYACRFKNVVIPQGSTIVSAVVKLTAEMTMSPGDCNLNCYFKAEDNGSQPNSAWAWWSTNLTTLTAWDAVEAFTADNQHSSPDLAASLQEVIGRSGFASDNSITFVLRNNSSDFGAARYIWQYNYDSGSMKAELEVEWTVVPIEKSNEESIGFSDIVYASLNSVGELYLPEIEDSLDAQDAVSDWIKNMAILDGFDLADTQGLAFGKLLSDLIFLWDEIKIGWNKSVPDTMAFNDSLGSILILLISDWLTIVDQEVNHWHGVDSIDDPLMIYDLPQIIQNYSKTVTDGLDISDAAMAKLLVTILDYMKFDSLAQVINKILISIDDGFNYIDAADRGFDLSVNSPLSVVDVNEIIGKFIKEIAEVLGVTDALSNIKEMQSILSDSVSFYESIFVKGNLYSVIYDSLKLSVTIELSGEIWECYVLNTPKFLPSMYSGYDFNSYCVFGNRAFGANDSGIFELSGDTDAGSVIHTGVILSGTDFGSPNQKRFRRGYLGITGVAPVMVFETEDGQREVYDIDTKGKVVISSDLKGKTWNLSIADFETLDGVKLIPVILTK